MYSLTLLIYLAFINTAHSDVVVLDDRLASYVAAFKAARDKHWPINAPRALGDIDDREVLVSLGATEGKNIDGQCVKGKSGYRVVLDDVYWLTSDPSRREGMLLHELGHCVYDLEHDNKMCGDDPCSVMNRAGLPGDVYNKQRERYLEEFFLKAAANASRQ